jgi:hypothetical protein
LADAQLLESYFTDRKVFRHNLSPHTIALLSKFQKDRKELLQRQKELREKLLAESAEKAGLDKDKKVLSTEDSKQESKNTSKQFLFGFPAQDKEIKKTVVQHDSKEITQQFINWLQQNADKLSKSESKNAALIQRVESGVLIDQKVLQQFIAESKVSNLSVAALEKLITQTEVAKPVTYTQVVESALKTGQINSALLVHNPYLVFPAGPPSLAAIVGVHATQALQSPNGVQEQASTPRLAIK